MRNFIQEGRMLTAKAPAGGVVSGKGVKIGDMFGIPAITAAEGDDFEMAVEGVFASESRCRHRRKGQGLLADSKRPRHHGRVR